MARVMLPLLLLLTLRLDAATPRYVSEDVLIPMRDGLRSHAVLLQTPAVPGMRKSGCQSC